MPETFSIVVPTADRRRYLPAALADLLSQRFPASAHEVLVVDDTAEALSRDQVEARIPTTPVRLRYERREGPPGINAARNTGIRRSRGSVVVFVDDDCRFGPTWLAAICAGIDSAPRAECFGGPISIALEPGHPRWCGREPFPITSLDHGDRDRYVDLVYGANFAVRRSALERIGPFRVDQPLYGDETEWILRLRRRGGLVRYIARAGVVHTRLAEDVTVGRLLRTALVRGGRLARWHRSESLSEPLSIEALLAMARRVGVLSAHALSHGCWSGAAHAVESSAYLVDCARSFVGRD